MQNRRYSEYLSEPIRVITESYMQDKRGSSADSQRNFKYALNQLADYLEKSPEQMKREDLNRFFDYLRMEKGNRNNTLVIKKRMLHAYFTYLEQAKEAYHFQTDFASLLDEVNLETYENQVQEENISFVGDIRNLMMYLQENADWALLLAVELSVRYGMSSSRIIGLTREDLFQTDGRFYLRTPKKPYQMKQDIELRDETVQLFLKACSPKNTYIFSSQRGGGQLSLRRLQQQLSDAAKAVCNESVSLNKLRNACVAYLLAEGASYREIATMTGSPENMMFRYRQCTKNLADAATRYRGVPLE